MTTGKKLWIVSACLLGRPCRYDGRASSTNVADLVDGEVVAVCPEELGELGTPRPAASLERGHGDDVLDGRARVLTNDDGDDVTDGFVKGAMRGLAIAREQRATHACLKARSPSCGVDQVHTRAGLGPGDGVFAALLKREGLAVFNDEELTP